MKGDCEGCKKQATYHLTVIEGGKKMTKHLCETCPKLGAEHGAVAAPGGAAAAPSAAGAHTPINELLTNFVMAHSAGAKEQQAGQCEACGLTWADFKQSGLLGCERDYDAFERELTPILQRAHEGQNHHTGKVPPRKGQGGVPAKARKPAAQSASDPARLRRELEKAVEAEDYERAAQLRDEIRRAEKGT